VGSKRRFGVKEVGGFFGGGCGVSLYALVFFAFAVIAAAAPLQGVITCNRSLGELTPKACLQKTNISAIFRRCLK